jgi:hypothetical protein
VTKKRRNSKKSSQSELILDIIPSKESRMTKCQISSKQQLLLKCLQTKEYYFSQKSFIHSFIHLFIYLFIIIMFPSYPNLDSIPRRKPKKKKEKETKKGDSSFSQPNKSY